MKRKVLCCVVFGTLALACPAWSDEESDRRDLISKIDSKLDNAASMLAGLESRSDVSELNSALGYVREAETVVSELSNKKGSDSRANEIVSKYPSYISSFRDATSYAIKLKQGQRLADSGAEQCKADEADLQTLIRNYVGNPDQPDEALTKLPEKGRQYGSKWTEKLSTWERHHKEMASNASSARFSVSDGNWSKVSSNFSSSVSQIGSHWMKKYEEAARACERLARGDRHPDIEKAVADLGSFKTASKATYKAVEADYREWLKDIKKLRKFSEDDREEMRKAMCSVGEYEMEQKISEIADRWASQMNSSYSTALGQADRLLRRTEEVKKRAPKSAPKLASAIRDVMKSIETLAASDLKGSNNPKIRARMEYGKKAHEEKTSSCTYPDNKFVISTEHCYNRVRPGSGCRLDCLRISSSTCTIYEVKPDSGGARSEGELQLKSYKEGLEHWYAKKKADLFSTYSDVKQCERDGTRLAVESAPIVTYSFCPSSVAELGERLDPIEPEVSGDGD
jgi:hypothetical protein